MRASASPAAESTFTAKLPAERSAPSVRERWSMQTSMSGGSSDKDATALAVAPAGSASPGAVTTVTAVGTSAIALRNSSGVGAVTGKGVL